MSEVPKKKKIRWSAAWAEARDLIWARRHRLLLGLVLMLISRLAGMVLPFLSKYLIDDVLTQGKVEMLPRLAWIVGAATVVQAVTSFALSQVLSTVAEFVEPAGALTYVAIAGALAATAAAGLLRPVRRALALEPVEALRRE